MNFVGLFLLSINISSLLCANILCICPTPALSHQVYFRKIWLKLLENGHNLTVITTDVVEVQSDFLKQVNINFLYEIYNKHKLLEILYKTQSFIEQITTYNTAINDGTKQILLNKKVQEVLSKRNHYDLILVELGLPVWYSLKEIFNCSMILISSLNIDSFSHSTIGDPSHPLLYPDLNSPYGETQRFHQRMESVIASLITSCYLNWILYPQQLDIVKKYINQNASDLIDAQCQADLMFGNYIPGFHLNRPTGPAVINLNGLHITRETNLDNPLKEVLDSNKVGVIYMSLGSLLKSDLLTNDTLTIFFNVFSKLSYTVLWKLDKNISLEQKNIVMRKWFPQENVLSHPSVKLFITQGGIHSIQEAIIYKTPMISLPFFGDQFQNSHRIETIGIGIQLDMKCITEEILETAITKVMTDEKYHEKIKELSKYSLDQPESALDTAIWWIERAIIRKDMRHLRNSSLKVPLYQILLLDVIATFFAVLIIMYLVAKIILKACIYSFITVKHYVVKIKHD